MDDFRFPSEFRYGITLPEFDEKAESLKLFRIFRLFVPFFMASKLIVSDSGLILLRLKLKTKARAGFCGDTSTFLWSYEVEIKKRPRTR